VDDLRISCDLLGAEVVTGIKRAKKLRAQFDAAGKPRKIRALGSVKRVVLYDTELRMEGSDIPLTADVRAYASASGTRQAHAFRADDDHRELVLNVDWPGGSQVTHWERNSKSLTGSLVEPSGLHAMAAAINTAAAQAEPIRRNRDQAVRNAAEAMREGLAELQEQVDQRLQTVEQRMVGLSSQVDELTLVKQGATGRDAQALDSQLRAARKQHQAAVVALKRAQDFLRACEQDLTLVQAAPTEPPVAVGSDRDMPAAEASPASPIQLLEDLAGLFRAGIITESEFDTKKAQILRRL
jgi:hypothetical protein